MRTHRLRTAAVGASILAVLLGVDTASSSSATVPGGGSPAVIQAQHVEQYAEATFPQAITGVSVAGDQRTVIAYRLPTPGMDEQIRAHFPRVPLRFVDARESRRDLVALEARIWADRNYWHRRGVKITVVGPQPATSTVEVGVQRGAGRAAPLPQQRYGTTAITVVTENPTLIPPAKVSHRIRPPSP